MESKFQKKLQFIWVSTELDAMHAIRTFAQSAQQSPTTLEKLVNSLKNLNKQENADIALQK